MEIQTIRLTETAQLKTYVPDSEIGYGIHRKRPGILLAPGGAYLIHATREREGVALEFLAKGYAVFVLEYSLGFSSREVKEQGAAALDTDARYPLPVLEMMEAIHYAKGHCEQLNLDPSRLFLMGFSAGAHVCASCGVFWNSPEFTSRLRFVPQGDELRVSGMVLCYPLLNPSPEKVLELNDTNNKDARLVKEFLFQTRTPSQEQLDAVNLVKHVDSFTIPAFLWHSIDDPIVYAVDTTRFVLSLQQHGVNCEYHLFDKGGHGLGLANAIYAQNEAEVQPDLAVWTELAHKWMERKKQNN
ncbi:MAG: alpha/beta hydrolase [Eubacteriales bacterium]|nr:alpha/beta hydrolase [Eubacteriales bacterium]